ncbi:zonular occludens toxin domain-containing protein [Escherichia coli]
MAISAYIGIPGSGKSYEAVCNVIIPAFTSGRRVVTNIYGLQKDKITERYPDATGEIIVVDNDDVLKADFFPFKGGEGSFCQFGDLIVIDEAWRIFGFRSSAATPSEPAEPPLSTEWRISGRMTSEGRAFVILVNGAGVLRAVPASSFNYKGMLMSGIIDGERVTLYTGKK